MNRLKKRQANLEVDDYTPPAPGSAVAEVHTNSGIYQIRGYIAHALLTNYIIYEDDGIYRPYIDEIFFESLVV